MAIKTGSGNNQTTNETIQPTFASVKKQAESVPKLGMKVLVLLVSFLWVECTRAFVSIPVQDSHPPTIRQKDVALLATTLDGRKIKGDIQPLNNFLLVKTADVIDSTEGGILLTGKAKIEKTEGTVVAVGPGRTHQDSGKVFDMPVEAGDGVVYGQFDGTEIDLDGEKHTLIRDDDILVKYTGDSLTLDSVQVVRDCILVFVEKKEVETEGGILIAQSSKKEQRPSTGEIVKVGEGRMAANGQLMAMEVSVGDMIKFRDFAGNEVEIEGKEYSVVRMMDVLAKF